MIARLHKSVIERADTVAWFQIRNARKARASRTIALAFGIPRASPPLRRTERPRRVACSHMPFRDLGSPMVLHSVANILVGYAPSGPKSSRPPPCTCDAACSAAECPRHETSTRAEITDQSQPGGHVSPAWAPRSKRSGETAGGRSLHARGRRVAGGSWGSSSSRGGAMESVGLLDRAGRRRSQATLSGFHQGRVPRNGYCFGGRSGLCRCRRRQRVPADAAGLERFATSRAEGSFPNWDLLRALRGVATDRRTQGWEVVGRLPSNREGRGHTARFIQNVRRWHLSDGRRRRVSRLVQTLASGRASRMSTGRTTSSRRPPLASVRYACCVPARAGDSPNGYAPRQVGRE